MKTLDKFFPPIGGIAPPFSGMQSQLDNAMRDQLALKALPFVYTQMIDLFPDDVEFSDKCQDIAYAVYELADAMMEARSKK